MTTTQPAPPDHARANPEIELLRALSIGLVIVMHAPLLCVPYPAGAIEGVQRWIHPANGVDMFFVISGYLMGRAFVGPYDAVEPATAADRGRRILGFWLRRFYRLFPASLLWVTLTFAASVISRRPELWLTPQVMFVKAVASIIAARNFQESTDPSFFGYMWSLSVENQFYLALPLLLLAVPRNWRVKSLLAICALNAIWRPGGEIWWMFRYDGLLYGLLLFELERSPLGAIAARMLPTRLPARATLFALASLVVLTAPLALLNFHPLAWAISNCAAFVLVFAASRQQRIITVPAVVRPALLWLGARSYALYLCHIPIWFAVIDIARRAGRPDAAFIPWRMALGFTFSLIAADLTHRLIEKPWQSRGRAYVKTFLTPPRHAPP